MQRKIPNFPRHIAGNFVHIFTIMDEKPETRNLEC